MKFSIFFIIIIFLTSCVKTPGINENPKKRNPKTVLSENSINEVEINIISLNKLNDNQLEFYNNNKIQEFDHKIKKFEKIYNYKYRYILGASDTVSINLSDVEDLDGSYIIDQDGKIDLPFVGKIKIDGLSLDQAQQVLFKKIEEYYKNPDLQITVEEYNSSKSYIVGAVTTQTTLNLNQEPVRLIEAAIKAGFNPSSGNKNFGTKGILRRDNKVFKINLENAFKNLDDKENFYLKKNDVIFIDRNSDTIHVFGEVSKPGIYYPNLGYSLTELVSTSGLNQLTANAKKIYVIRENYDKFLSVSVFQLDIENPINLIVGRKFNLQSKDIVYIPASGIVKWNRTISLLLPQTDLFKSYNPIINNGLQTYEEP
jgi:protein involved in polysaccharide export with SLBB domain